MVDELVKKLKECREALKKGKEEDDALDAKIRAKLRAEMDKRGFGEADATRHIIDRDRGEQAAELPKPKKQPLLQSEQEICKFNQHGQWSLDKSNAIKPFGQNVYDSAANINRKATRTGEERPEMGRNQGVRRYTTSGSSIQQAHEKNQQKEQDIKTQASTRTFADMSEEEKAALRAKYEVKKSLTGADVSREALVSGSLPDLTPPSKQPTDEQMFGHLVKTEEQVRAAEERWKSGNRTALQELSKPVDHLNKSDINDRSWETGKSFNSMLTKEELIKRNSTVGED